MSQEPSSQPDPAANRTLSPADAAALDAVLIERGLAAHDGPAIPAESVAQPGRVQKVRGLLGLLDGDAADTKQNLDPSELRARTLRHIARHKPVPVSSLGPDDALALDTVLAGRGADGEASNETNSLGPVLAGSRERCENVASVLSLLDRDTADAAEVPPDLAARTLDAVRQAQQRERFAQQIDMLRHGPRTVGVSLRQVLSAAAVLLLGVSLLLPMMSNAQRSRQQTACMSNMGLIGQAFNSYAADHAGVLPRGNSQPGSPWWNVGLPNAVTEDGTVFSNSAHLYMVVRAGYITPDKLACRTNTFAPSDGQMTVSHLDWSTPLAVSYSYQNQFTPEALHVDDATPTFVVLADKNPLFIARDGRVVFNADARPDAPSQLHGGRGQNALSIDGNARWTVTPTNAALDDAPASNDDLFWSVQGKAEDYRYSGDELPAGVASDSFLVP